MSAETPTITGTGRASRLPVIPVAAVLILAAGALVGMTDVLAWVASAWYSFFGVGVYSHGYLVLGISFWMGWTYWQRDPPSHLAPNWWALIPLALLSLGLIVMELLYIGSTRALLLPLFFIAGTTLVFGWPATRRLLVPVLFVYFGLLPWWMLNPFLQWLVTRVVEGLMMNFGNVPVFIEETYIHVPAGTFEVASACSGLSFFLSGIALGVFYAAMYLQSWVHRASLLMAAAAAALVANWIRVWTLVLIGHYSDLQHWLIDDHYLYGWVLFIIAWVPVLFMARRMEHRELAKKAEGSASAAVKSTAAGQSERSGEAGDTAPVRRQRADVVSAPITLLIAATCGALVLAMPRLVASQGSVDDAVSVASLPERLFDVAVQVEGEIAWAGSFRHSQSETVVYAFNDHRVEVFRSVYAIQNRDQHLFLRPNTFVGSRWTTDSRNVVSVEINGSEIRVIELLGRVGGRHRVIWSWYDVGGWTATTRLGAKLVEGRALLAGNTVATAMAVALECTPDCDRSRDELAAFLRQADGLLP